MGCKTAYFAGLGECAKMLERVVGFQLTDKGTVYTAATFELLSTHKTNIASATTASRVATAFPLIQYEKTTDDREVQTSNLGIKTKTNDPAPSMIGYLDASFCDYKTVHDLESKWFDVILYTADGDQIGTIDVDGNYKGFRCKIFTKKDLPESDNAQLSYPVDIYFRSAKEFENAVVASPDYDFDDILDTVPVGLSLSVVTAYASGTGDIVIKVVKRCTSEAYLGLAVADCEVLESNGVPVVACNALVENGDGQYTITIQELTTGVPADLAAGDWFKLQVSDDDATYVTYLSQAIKQTVQ
jgi:hypothetical protein